MRLSDKSSRLFAEFFEEMGCCGASDFPDVRIYTGRGARILTRLLIVDGITIGKSVFVDRKYLSRRANGSAGMEKGLLAHELAHVVQYTNEGKIRFLRTYIRDFWSEFRSRGEWTGKAWFEAYQAIPHEIEARELAAMFEPWLASRKK
ncbi:MAG: DUF4157 domain-containing protein [Pyrinomonadaceae bacterium]|nr:DUF4157 domain-containing protein [Pyrinomonadaceae bacterium]